jgi:putative hydrolase of the HAD superfamily
MKSKKYAAVIFDLFGTLINNLSFREYESVLRQMASVLSVPSDDFVRWWSDTSHERNTGIIPSPEPIIRHICQKLGVPVEDARVRLAARIRFDYTRRSLVPRPDAITVLSHLKAAGYKTGLISDCSSEVPKIWPDTLFARFIDMAVFSCSVGLRKPDPRIYKLVTSRLAVEPQDCLYIGDGSSQELTGAARVGMHPVLLRIDAESTEPHLVNREKWDGPAILSLVDVLTLCELRS